ncbi:UDP-glucose/GDP-mannose dehydrogenase family protein [Bacillus sp. FJAT-29790]|uniref:UDP-glucose dehydrogenase family protein n=1 Tax=Bacillus sp. FJAT-29790 TaxID=1895002 RepID=UPI001C227FFE|nr:UDP-glucose/GDP-mannose dehydrogenase family protein [Bacillus sp. FJAT-29790]MBU8881099.1 UDP-glucose/GDP-mannose dehydrogenase family protein [Bacillus sp. FJAT-29790]
MKITIAGTGYVGLVTGVCLSEVGHHITCFDVNKQTISLLNSGESPIYEPGLENLIRNNKEAGRLHFTSNPEKAYAEADCIFIAVGTPENEDGSANLLSIENVALSISKYVHKDITIVTKSTVPVGTNEWIGRIIQERIPKEYRVTVVSNPEFLREGSAIYDTFNGDRIVIGSDDREAGKRIEKIYEPFNIPIIHTDIRSAEMIKYASNGFLAAKISFINEVANLCEKTGANVEKVAEGMGYDKRIGNQFLRAGIGFGGSCFPKDTKALQHLAAQYDYDFKILQAIIDVNNVQKNWLYEKAKQHFGSLNGKKAAVLGLAFKPNTDDIREAPSLELIQNLLLDEANVTVYDPIAMSNVGKIYGSKLQYAESVKEAIENADVTFIVTEWKEIKEFPLTEMRNGMLSPVIFDGRNCYSLEDARRLNVKYFSIGRMAINEFE